MHKFKLLTLAILISMSATSFAAEEEEEIPDLKKADNCFRIVDEGMRLGVEMRVEQKTLKQKEERLSIWKRKINKETNSVGDEPGVRLNRLKADVQKYNKAETEYKAENTEFNKKMTELNDNKAQNIKLSCSKTKFSEDAIEQICTISKKYSRSCTEALKNEK